MVLYTCDVHGCGLSTPVAGANCELDILALLKHRELAIGLDLRVVREKLLAAVLRTDEAKAPAK
jgi:hypothetical protein